MQEAHIYSLGCQEANAKHLSTDKQHKQQNPSNNLKFNTKKKHTLICLRDLRAAFALSRGSWCVEEFWPITADAGTYYSKRTTFLTSVSIIK